MNEGKYLLHYIHIVLPRTSPNNQGLLLTINSVIGIETLQYNKGQNFKNSVKENGYDLENLVTNQVLFAET